MKSLILIFALLLLSVANCGNAQSVPELKSPPQPRKIVNRPDGTQVVCFGNRCEIRRPAIVEQAPTPAQQESNPAEAAEPTREVKSVLVRGRPVRGIFGHAVKFISKLRIRK